MRLAGSVSEQRFWELQSLTLPARYESVRSRDESPVQFLTRRQRNDSRTHRRHSPFLLFEPQFRFPRREFVKRIAVARHKTRQRVQGISLFEQLDQQLRKYRS